jgi:hypothetical protein
VELKAKIRNELSDVWLQQTSLLGRQLNAALAWRRDGKESADAAAGQDVLRVGFWTKLLDRKNIAMDDPLYPVAKMAGSSKPAETWADLPAYQKNRRSRQIQ